MPLGTTRRPLEHDWEHGNYIENGVMDGKIDWDHLETLEQSALNILSGVIDRCEDIMVNYSGGIDAQVALHLLHQLDYHDAEAVCFRSPEMYSHFDEFTRGFAEGLGFPFKFVYADEYDIHWVKENRDEYLFPTWDGKCHGVNYTFRIPSHEYRVENDIDAFVTGGRQEHNRREEAVVPDIEAYARENKWWVEPEEMQAYQVNPIYNWNFEYTLAYLDKYSLPIVDSYRTCPTGVAPWHRFTTVSSYGKYRRSEQEVWYVARRVALRHGYTDFWTDHILEHFPEGEEMAGEHAADTDKAILGIEESYDHGADAAPALAPVGPFA